MAGGRIRHGAVLRGRFGTRGRSTVTCPIRRARAVGRRLCRTLSIRPRANRTIAVVRRRPLPRPLKIRRPRKTGRRQAQGKDRKEPDNQRARHRNAPGAYVRCRRLG